MKKYLCVIIIVCLFCISPVIAEEIASKDKVTIYILYDKKNCLECDGVFNTLTKSDTKYSDYLNVKTIDIGETYHNKLLYNSIRYKFNIPLNNNKSIVVISNNYHKENITADNVEEIIDMGLFNYKYNDNYNDYTATQINRYSDLVLNELNFNGNDEEKVENPEPIPEDKDDEVIIDKDNDNKNEQDDNKTDNKSNINPVLTVKNFFIICIVISFAFVSDWYLSKDDNKKKKNKKNKE